LLRGEARAGVVPLESVTDITTEPAGKNITDITTGKGGRSGKGDPTEAAEGFVRWLFGPRDTTEACEA
jgi:hypothetical protein